MAYTFKPGNNEDPAIMEFLDKQTNRNDMFRYLIEKEIYENGIRNLENIIPSKRSAEYFKEYFKSLKPISNTYTNIVTNEEVSITKQGLTDMEESYNQNTSESIESPDYKVDKKDIIDGIKESTKEEQFDELEIPDCYQ